MYHRQMPITRSLTAIILTALLLFAGLTPRARADAGVPGWRQSNASGFGSPKNSRISSLVVFGDNLYAGTASDDSVPAQIWRTPDGRIWSQFSPSWPADTGAVFDAISFGGRLYVGTARETGGEIWRTDGATWQQVATGGLGDANNYSMAAFAVFGGKLYVATGNIATGIEIWRSSTGNNGSWQQVNADGFGRGATWENVTLDVFGGYLYVGASRKVGADGARAELWRSANGTTWTPPVFTDGLGYPNNSDVSAMAEFHGSFYIGTRNTATGGQLWRSSNGLDFSPVFTDGLGKKANRATYGLFVFEDALYLVFNNFNGAEVWQTADGMTWRPVMQGGWGKGGANAWADYFDKAAAAFRGSLYIGTENDTDGGEIWQMLRQVYLPLVQKRR
jgi:hypothetical protein